MTQILQSQRTSLQHKVTVTRTFERSKTCPDKVRVRPLFYAQHLVGEDTGLLLHGPPNRRGVPRCRIFFFKVSALAYSVS